MSEPTSPPVAGYPAVRPEEPLTPQAIDAVLADFRAWLEQLAGAADSPTPPSTSTDGQPAVDLHTLVSQFVALRHEVNLQTRAARTQQEQNAEALRQLGQALEALEHARDKPAAKEPDDEALRPLLKTLVDLYDALALARGEIQRVQANVGSALDPVRAALPAPVASAGPESSRWEQWAQVLGGFIGATSAGRRHAERQRQEAERQRQAAEARQALDRVAQLLGSVVTGYTMSLQRVERALQQHGLEPIAAVGEPFDPERMEVVEVVGGSGQAAGEVVTEVRRGYLWRGRLFRYAQVSVAK